MDYFVTSANVTTRSGIYSLIGVAYYGVANQFEVWLVYLWAPYAVYVWWKTRGGEVVPRLEARDFRLARLALLWFLVVFLGYVGLYFYGRVTYPYYFIEAVPALAMGAAYVLTGAGSLVPSPMPFLEPSSCGSSSSTRTRAPPHPSPAVAGAHHVGRNHGHVNPDWS